VITPGLERGDHGQCIGEPDDIDVIIRDMDEIDSGFHNVELYDPLVAIPARAGLEREARSTQ